MLQLTRRDFLAQASLVTGAAILTSQAKAADQSPEGPKRGSDLVTLGASGIKTSLMGIGTGSHGTRRQSNQTRLGSAKFTAMIRHALDRGITYFDTADQYGSHIFLREALQGVDREKLFIQTKTRAVHPEVARVDIERFRQELAVDRIDSLLMHCMQKATWPTDMRPVMDVLLEAKEKGLVRSVGISCHTVDALSATVDCPWVDVQLARINPFGSLMDGPVEVVVPRLRAMHARGKGVIGMKLFACGGHILPEERLESLKFVMGLGCVDAFTIGCESPEQIDENLEMIEKVLA